MRKILAINDSCRGFLHGIHIREPNHFSPALILVIEITCIALSRQRSTSRRPPRFALVIPMISSCSVRKMVRLSSLACDGIKLCIDIFSCNV